MTVQRNRARPDSHQRRPGFRRSSRVRSPTRHAVWCVRLFGVKTRTSWTSLSILNRTLPSPTASGIGYLHVPLCAMWMCKCLSFSLFLSLSPSPSPCLPPSLSLSPLSLPPSPPLSFRMFSSNETLCGESKYYCEQCCSKQEATKRLRVKKLPQILALHLKRFKYLEQHNNFTKLTHRVVFPWELKLFNTVCIHLALVEL